MDLKGKTVIVRDRDDANRKATEMVAEEGNAIPFITNVTIKGTGALRLKEPLEATKKG